MKVHENLRVSGSYSFRNGDYVTYKSNEGEQYCILFYDEELGAFLLLHFKDDTYTNLKVKENGENDVNFLHEIGLDVLEKFVS